MSFSPNGDPAYAVKQTIANVQFRVFSHFRMEMKYILQLLHREEVLALGLRGFGFRGFSFCDLKRPYKPRLQNRWGLGVFRVHR